MKTADAAIQIIYKGAIKKILFLMNPETVHKTATAIGKKIGEFPFAQNMISIVLAKKNPALAQLLFDIEFLSPVGLAAGFDYQAELTQILPSLGFGFGTVGTVTNNAYQGNPGPMLGRLPKSKSLMVNKGFKNIGVEATLATLRGKEFFYPVGVSIGKTNTEAIATQEEAVADVAEAFRNAEKSGVDFSYYELNISCPNLSGSIEFYQPAHLESLLAAIQELNILRPLFVKMPIANTDQEISAMMEVIIRYSFVKAVIFGNLQTNRANPLLQPDELARFPQGNFSGIPCQQRSDELIKMAFKNYGSRLKIIGCGGIFSPEDAYRKIKLGASLVQLITGLIFEGPQLVSQINEGVMVLLHKDGYRSLSDAIGADA